MKSIIRVLAVAACMLAGCHTSTLRDVPYAASSPSGGVPPWEMGEKFVGINGGPCGGTCPVYELYVFSDGRVIFIGKEYTGRQGRVTKNVDPSAYRELAVLMAKLGVLDGELKRGTCLSGRPHLTVMRGPSKDGNGVRVQDLDSGCEGHADLARDIEKAFIADTEVERWIAPRR